MKKNLCLTLLSLLIISSIAVPSAFAYNGVRAIGMGGAFIAVADDIQSIYWNPAGIANISERQFGWQRVVSDRNYSNHLDVVELAIPLESGESAIGLSYINLADAVYDGNRLRAYGWVLSYGQRISEKIAIGVNGRYLKETLNNKTSATYPTDIGILYKASPKLSFGLMIQDATGRDTETNWRPGVAYRPDNKTVIACDVYNATESYNTKREYSLGIEHMTNDTLALRVGNYHGSMTYGIGVKVTKDTEFNFAYMGGDFDGRKVIGMQSKF